ncbi:hypothetical protein YC2023_101177 [Brassica napus]
MRCYNKYTFSILISLLLMPILDSNAHTLPSSCQTECGNISIPYPFGIQEGCYLNEWYRIKCRNSTFPFLIKIGMEVVFIPLPNEESESLDSLPFGTIRVKIPIASVRCSRDGKESGSALNLTGSPFYFGRGNSLVAAGCNSKSSLTNIEPSMVGCVLNCTASKDTLPRKTVPFFGRTGCPNDGLTYTESLDCTNNEREGQRRCDESFGNGNSTSRGECRVAFLTDEDYTFWNVTKPQRFFAQGYTKVTLGWVIQTKNLSVLNSLSCKNTKEFDNLRIDAQRTTSCICENITISGTSYARCMCIPGYIGNPYLLNECKDINECLPADSVVSRGFCSEGDTCVNVVGHYKCVRDKTIPILIGESLDVSSRRVTRRKKKFFKRNGGLLLQQQLNTDDRGNVEKTRIFTSRELEKATENFCQNRILGQGGQGTVYKGMLVDGKTVAVKKSKVVDEDKLEEFINEVVILSQINHRHVVKLFGCCLETEVPVLVYEFISNGNLFQQIHEESDDYTMLWGVRLRIAVDISGALSYLHSAACSPVYHRDVKSTNILLDEKYLAKVSDFGTSRSVTVDHTHWTTVISGTVGYVDPEYYGSSQYTDKSDVYSFGVILVELITGEKPVIALPDSQEIRGLADHFRAAMKENKFFDIMDARIRDACKPEQVMAVANLARRCLNSKGKKRPYMTEVFAELERILSSPEDSLVRIENDDGDDAGEEGRNTIGITDSWTAGVTAPAFSTVTSPSSADVQPLFPRATW